MKCLSNVYCRFGSVLVGALLIIPEALAAPTPQASAKSSPQPSMQSTAKSSPVSTPLPTGTLPRVHSVDIATFPTVVLTDGANGTPAVFAPGDEVFGRYLLLEVSYGGVTLVSKERTLHTLSVPVPPTTIPPTADRTRELFNFLTATPPPSTLITEIIKASSLEGLLKNGAIAVTALRWSKGAEPALEDLLISARKEARRKLLSEGVTPSTLTLFTQYIRASIVAGDYKDLVSFSDAALGVSCTINLKLAWTPAQKTELGRSLSSLVLAVKGAGEVSKALKLALLCDQSLKADTRLVAYVKSGAAQVLLAENRMSEALTMYRKVLELAPNDRVAGAAYYWIALDAKSRGDTLMAEGALAGLEKTVGTSKDSYDKKLLLTRAKLLKAGAVGGTK